MTCLTSTRPYRSFHPSPSHLNQLPLCYLCCLYYLDSWNHSRRKMSHRCASQPFASLAWTFSSLALSKTSKSCPRSTRLFTSSIGSRSSKRKLVTASAYHPSNLNPPPSPRNAPVPQTSIPGQLQADIHHLFEAGKNQQADQVVTREVSQSGMMEARNGMTEEEAQISKPVEQPDHNPQSVSPSIRPKRKLRARKAAMTLSQAAVQHLQSLLALPDPKLIRVGVKNKGCSGLAYDLEYVEKPGLFDEEVDQDGVKVLIESKALLTIIGSEMDWVEDKLSQRFVFRNPNISESSM